MKKIITLLAIFISGFNSAFCQEIQWQHTIGGNDFDVLSSMSQTTDGGYIIGGYSSSDISGNKTENHFGGPGVYDYWVVKTDASGNIQWQNTIGGAHFDYLNYTEQTADGGYILGGSSKSNIFGDKTQNSYNNSYDYWVVKLDATGNIQWQKTIGGNQDDALASIHQTTDGGYILAGYSLSGISGDKTETWHGYQDCWIIKLDAAGNIQWQNSIGGNKDDDPYSIIQTADGGYIFGATSWSGISWDKSENSLGRDFWVVKLDAAGNIQWQNTIGGNGTDDLYSIEQTSDGGYIIGGSSNSQISGDKTESSYGSIDYWVLKLDNTGAIQWQKTLGGTDNDYARSMHQMTNGGYIVGGYSSSAPSGNKIENRIGYSDYWFMQLDNAGNLLWQKAIGAYYFEYLVSIQVTSDGNFLLGGYSHSNRSGDKSDDNVGNSDFWIAKITDKFNYISGKLFADLNSNQIQDANEPVLKNKKVYDLNSSRVAFSHNDGLYGLSVIDPGNFTVVPNNLPYYTPAPATRNINFLTIHQVDSFNDFAYQPSGTFNDLCVSLSALGRFRGGRYAYYTIHYLNMGTTTLTPTIIFFNDTCLTKYGADLAPSSSTSNSYTWNLGPLAPFQSGDIFIKTIIHNTAPIGSVVHSSAVITPTVNDAYVPSNYAGSSVLVRASYDPNGVYVDRDTVLTSELASPPDLDYIIYFQNTGNDTAFNISILNSLPPELDASSFEFLSSSSPVDIDYCAGSRLMTFGLNNILLPDSTVNEPLSHGYIRYRVKPLSTLVAGTTIRNNAGIVFDFNDPVLTDTAVTKIVLPTGTQELNLQSSGFNVYPNPFNGQMNINFILDNNAFVKIEVVNAVGQTIKTVVEEKINSGNQRISFNTEMFSRGIYFIKMMVNGKMSVKKIVKM